MPCFMIWIEIPLVTWWLKWAYAQSDFTSLNYGEDWLIDFEWLLNHKCDIVILVNYLMKMAFGIVY